MLNVGELFGTLGLDTRDWDKGIQSAQRSAERFAAAVGLIGGAAAGIGLKFSAEMEQTGVAFETLFGSAERGQQMLSDLQQFAASTPFELPGLLDSARLLKAMGFEADAILPSINGIGEAVAALGGGEQEMRGVARALGQINAKGKLSAEEINQLTDAIGFGWAQMAEGLGMTAKDAMKQAEQGAISSGQAINAFFKYSAENFGGAMDALSKTFLGRVSTLKDVVRMQLGGMMDPVRENLTEVIPSVIEFSNNFLGAVGPSIQGALTTVTDLVSRLVTGFNALDSRAQAVVANVGMIVTAVVALGGAISAVGIPAIAATLQLFVGVTAAVITLAAVIGSLKKAWDGNILGIKDTTKSAFSTIERYINAAISQWDDFLTSLRNGIAGVGNFLGVINDTALRDIVTGDSVLTISMEGIEDAGNELSSFASDFGSEVADSVMMGLESAFGVLPKEIRSELERILDFTAPDFDSGNNGSGPAEALWGTFEDDIVGFSDETSDAMDKAAKEIADSLDQAAGSFANQFGTDMFGGAFGGGMSMAAGGPLGVVAGALMGIVRQSEQYAAVQESFQGATQELANIIGEAIAPLASVGESLTGIVRVVGRVLGPIIGVIAKRFEAMARNFAVIDSIFKALDPIFKALGSTFEAMKVPFEGLEVASRALFEVVRFVAKMLIWIVRAIFDVWNSMIGVLDSVFEAFGDVVGKVFPKLEDKLSGLFDGLTVSTKALDDAMENLTNMTYEDASATEHGITATVLATRTFEELNQSMQNIPEGFKVAAARFEAMDADIASTTTTFAETGPSGSGTVYYIDNVNIQGADANEVLDMFESKLSSRATADTGTSIGRPSRWGSK